MPSIPELRQLYETADRFAREVGELRSEVPIPAHNELRYAGHHLLQSLRDEGAVADEDQARKAKNHCERAMYEAAEAGIIHILEAITEFRRAYKSIVVSEVVSEYREIIRKAKAARELIIAGRANRVTVEQHASQLMDVCRDLSVSLDILDASRDDLNAKREEQDSSRRRAVLRIVIGLLGIAVAIAALS